MSFYRPRCLTLSNLLGVMYAYGQGVPQNSTLAAFWFRRSIAHGDHDAEADLDKLNRNTASQQRAMDAATSLLQTPTSTATRWERATLEHDDAADGVSLRKCSFRSLNGFAFSVNRRGVCPVVVEVDPVSGTSRDLH